MLRITCLIIAALSLALTLWNGFQIWRNPAVQVMADRGQMELAAVLNRELTKAATPQAVEARLTTLLDQEPVPWLAVNAIRQEAQSRGIVLSQALNDRLTTSYDRDHGLIQTSGKCLKCGWDPAACELSAILLCRAPVDLTPVGDITGVIRESGNYVLGNEVDRIDLTLSAVGLGATGLAPLTGGTSLSVKLGASALKTTRKLGNLSPGLAKMLTRTADDAVNWKVLSEARPTSFPETLSRAINTDAIKPLADTARAAGDIRATTGVLETLHLLKFVDNASDAARTARAAKSLGPRTVSAFELVGKSRIFRASLRYSDEAMGAILGLIGLGASLLAALGSTLVGMVSRRAARAMKPG